MNIRESSPLRVKRPLGQIRALNGSISAIIQAETDPTRELRLLDLDVLVHGDEWKELKEGQATLERLGIEFKLLPYTQELVLH